MKIDFNSIISIIKHCLYICIFIYVNYNWPTARPNWLKLCEGTNPWVKKINEFFFKIQFIFKIRPAVRTGLLWKIPRNWALGLQLPILLKGWSYGFH